MVTIYLAGACRDAPDEGAAWRESATEKLKAVAAWCDTSIKIINPLDYFSYSRNQYKSHKQIKEFYLSKLKNSDIVLCNLEGTATSVGTGQELQYAKDHEIPVISFNAINSYQWLEVDSQCVFNNITEAIDYIRDYYLK